MKKTTLRHTIIILMAIMVMAIATVSVNAANNYASIADDKETLYVGQTMQLGYSYQAAGQVNWESSNTSVVTVKNGKITAKKAGKAIITLEAGDEEDTCEVIVEGNGSWVNAKSAYTKLNNYRKKGHLKALKKDKKLEKIAKIRAKEMAESGQFSHTRPNGKSGLTLIKGNKYKGENIAMGQTTGAQVSKAWYNSPGHKANMMRKQFTKVGIACYKYNGVTYWAQVFSN